jgi:hypothetical protein
MERSGVPSSGATKITGPKTEAVYHRYVIVTTRICARRPG